MCVPLFGHSYVSVGTDEGQKKVLNSLELEQLTGSCKPHDMGPVQEQWVPLTPEQFVKLIIR